MGTTAANVFKATALFLGFFGLQFALVPDFLMSENFQSGSYTLDKWHYFVMRGCGCAFLGLAGFYWQTADQADTFMLVNTVTFTLTSIALPLNAQLNLPVSLPVTVSVCLSVCLSAFPSTTSRLWAALC